MSRATFASLTDAQRRRVRHFARLGSASRGLAFDSDDSYSDDDCDDNIPAQYVEELPQKQNPMYTTCRQHTHKNNHRSEQLQPINLERMATSVDQVA